VRDASSSVALPGARPAPADPSGRADGTAPLREIPPSDPRESMRRLPQWLQHPLTLFTGRALPEQRALPWWSPTYHLATASLTLLAGLVVGATGAATGGWWLALLLPGWMITLHGMRNLRMLIFHQCAHRNMYRRPEPDTAIGETLSSLLLVQNFQRYRREHVSDHHAVHHMTLRDPTVQAFLLTLDLHPGMSYPQMRRRLLRRLFSPVFHTQFAVARVRSFAQDSSRREKILATGIHGGALIVAASTGHLATLALCLYVPLFPLFQVSNTLRLCVKHTFPAPGTTIRRGREYFASLTSAVFIGEAVPPPGGPVLRRGWRWVRWTLRMAFVHAPVRYLLITADTPVHDWHHRFPAAPDWAHHLYARQADDDAGHPGWPPYTEFWGFPAAMQQVFGSLSRADPDEFDVRRIRDVSKRELFAAFDD